MFYNTVEVGGVAEIEYLPHDVLIQITTLKNDGERIHKYLPPWGN